MKQGGHIFTSRSWIRAGLAALVGAVIIGIGHGLRHIPELEPYPTAKELVSFCSILLHEVGFAAIVASAIYMTFEFFTHEENQREWNDRIETITSKVFYGVLRRNLPEALLNEANLLILNQDFIRKNLGLEYYLSDQIVDDENGTRRPYVKLEAVLRYTVQNISDETKTFPIRVAVPNPTLKELRLISDVISCSYAINGAAKSEPDLRNARDRFRREMYSSNATHITCEFCNIEIPRDGYADVHLRYIMPKEDEDTEVFETLYPSDSLNLMIVDRDGLKRRIGASAHHPGELENQTLTADGGPYQYRLNRYLLPHQGASIWWKRRQRGSETKTAGAG